jgi:hypothetical protein
MIQYSTVCQYQSLSRSHIVENANGNANRSTQTIQHSPDQSHRGIFAWEILHVFPSCPRTPMKLHKTPNLIERREKDDNHNHNHLLRNNDKEMFSQHFGRLTSQSNHPYPHHPAALAVASSAPVAVPGASSSSAEPVVGSSGSCSCPAFPACPA